MRRAYAETTVHVCHLPTPNAWEGTCTNTGQHTQNPLVALRTLITASGPANFHTVRGLDCGQAAEGLFAFCGLSWPVSEMEKESPGLG